MMATADWNEAMSDSDTGRHLMLLSAIRNSCVVRWRPPVSAWYSPMAMEAASKTANIT